MSRASLVKEDMLMALETIRNHKVRSFLTVMGVMIGVTVAIVVASILLGFEDNVQASLNEFGVDNLFIFKFDPGFHFSRLSPEERLRKSLTYEDGMAIKEQIPSVKDVAVQVLPHVGEGFQQPVRIARYKSHELVDNIFRGTTASFADVESLHMKEGRFYTEQEDVHRLEVVVLGFDAEQTLFPGETAVGKQLMVDGNPYTVLGVVEKRKNPVPRGDNEVFIPYRTYRKHYPQDDENFIMVMAYQGMKSAAEDQVRGLLRMRRRVPFDKPDSFGISSAESLGEQFRQIAAGVFL